MLVKKTHCTIPIAYRCQCNGALYGSNTLCQKCLAAKWVQQPSSIQLTCLRTNHSSLISTDDDRKTITTICADPLRCIDDWVTASYLVDVYGNDECFAFMIPSKFGTSTTIRNAVCSLLFSKHNAFSQHHFAFLCTALRQHDDNMLQQLLLCNDFRQYCSSELHGPRECYKNFLFNKCVFWNSITCIRHIVELTFFTDKQFTSKCLTMLAARHQSLFNVDMWLSVWHTKFTNTFELCWHDKMFTEAVLAGNYPAWKFITNLDNFMVCVCNVLLSPNKIRKLRQWHKSHATIAICQSCKHVVCTQYSVACDQHPVACEQHPVVCTQHNVACEQKTNKKQQPKKRKHHRRKKHT